MDIPSRHVDDAIAYSLETESVVGAAQKNRAWEKLQQKAVQQVILSPYAVEPRQLSRSTPKLSAVELLLVRIRRGIGMLVTDEAMYERAARRRETLQRMPYATVTGPQQIARFHMADILRYGLL